VFCIASFIILGIISIFSASHRKLARDAWHCVARKARFKPCDTNFKDETKSRLLAPLMVRSPKIARYADRIIDVLAWVFIVVSVWSLYVAVKSGLNLYVYGTCSPRNAAACSLSSEACSIESYRPSFYTSLKSGTPHTWVATEFSDFAKTIAAVPTRLQTWKAEEYVPQDPSYYTTFDASKPTALEIIDPGCQFCAELFRNIKSAGFESRYNLTYIAYPIKDPKSASGYKFQGSEIISRYLEALRRSPRTLDGVPGDWRILERLYAGNDGPVTYQAKVNTLISQSDIEPLIKTWLKEFGYTESEITAIATDAASDTITQRIEENRRIVDERIKTVKIPTIIFDGKRHDGVQDVNSLR
jgi:hypothetical protein